MGHSSFRRSLCAPTWGPPQAAVWICAAHGLLPTLQGNLCCSAWSTFSPYLFSDLSVYRHFFLLYILTPLSHNHSMALFFPFCASFCQDVPTRAVGSAMPCTRWVGAAWNWLCPAPGSLHPVLPSKT